MGRVLKCKQKVTSRSPKFCVNIAPVYAAGTTLFVHLVLMVGDIDYYFSPLLARKVSSSSVNDSK